MACPVDHSFDPLAADYLADPYPAFSRYRREQPVFFAPSVGSYVVTRYEDIDRILMDPETFSSANTVTPMWAVSDEAKAVLAKAFPPVPTLTNADGERHAKMRRYVAAVLSPRRVVTLRPAIEETTHRLVDAMAEKDVADVYADLAYPLPAFTAFTLLGFPAGDIEMLKSWVTDRQTLTWGKASGPRQMQIARNVVAFSEYIEDAIRQRLAQPRDDLISELVQTHREEPDALTLVDIANIVFLLSAGAHESTTNLIVHGIRRLLEHPEQWRALCADAGLIPNAIEEALRYDASAVAWPRITRRDTMIGSVAVPAGSPILIVFGAGNRDGSAFDEPERFDIRRTGARRHLSFGKGIHFCIGAPLARIELDVVLKILARRTPELELVDGQPFPYQENAVMRSPHELLVRPRRPAQSNGNDSAAPEVTRTTAITIDRDICMGSGMCVAAAPEAFALDDDGIVLPGPAVSALSLDAAREIVAQCPSGALRLKS